MLRQISINNDLRNINTRAYQWKMNFKLDTSKTSTGGGHN